MRRVIRRSWLLPLLVLLFFGLLSALVPYVHDDWLWGTYEGANGFWGNGRWTGNNFVLLMTRSSIIKTLVMACGETIIVMCPVLLEGKGRSATLIISLMFFLLMPANIASQTVSWCAGFANYGLSTVAVCIFVCLISPLLLKQSLQNPYQHAFKLLIVCLLGSMCAEAITVLFLIVSFFYIIKAFICHEERFRVLSYATSFVGSLCGAFIMFSRADYQAGGYFLFYGSNQKTFLDFASACWESFTRLNMPILIDAAPLLVAVTFIHILLLRKGWTVRESGAYERCLAALLSWLCAYLFLRCMVPDWQPVLGYTRIVDAVCLLSWLGALGISIFVSIPEGKQRCQCLLLLACACIPAAALTAVWPNNPRSYMTSYCMLSCIGALEFSELLSPKNQRSVFRKLIPFVAILCAFWFTIFGYNALADYRRVRWVRERAAAGDRVISLRELPYASYVCYGGRLMGEGYDRAFLDFYGVDSDLELVNISYNEPDPNIYDEGE